MRLFITLICFVSFSVASALEFRSDGNKIINIKNKEFISGVLSINGKIVKLKSVQLYNAWRKYTKIYEGFDFYLVLDAVYGIDWRSKAKISFVALDGYRQSVSISKMLKVSSTSYTGLIAIREKGTKGFSKFKRGEKEVDPGPIYLVWENFKKGLKTKHGDDLKWPYQLKTINISSK